MTWRAFILGLLAVAGISLLEPYAGHGKGWGGFSSTSFPGGAVLVLVVLTVGANVLIKLIRRGWALKRPELMLIWCMLIVGAAVPSNLMRFWFPVLAAPSYLGRRARCRSLVWQQCAFSNSPFRPVLGQDHKKQGRLLGDDQQNGILDSRR